eukprot:142428-Chlamydomonas_euryale.AAC.3
MVPCDTGVGSVRGVVLPSGACHGGAASCELAHLSLAPILAAQHCKPSGVDDTRTVLGLLVLMAACIFRLSRKPSTLHAHKIDSARQSTQAAGTMTWSAQMRMLIHTQLRTQRVGGPALEYVACMDIKRVTQAAAWVHACILHATDGRRWSTSTLL